MLLLFRSNQFELVGGIHEILRIRLGLEDWRVRLSHRPRPANPLRMPRGLLSRSKLEHHGLHRITAARPSHQGIFPTCLAIVKVNSPCLGVLVQQAALHGVSGGLINIDASLGQTGGSAGSGIHANIICDFSNYDSSRGRFRGFDLFLISNLRED